MYECWLYDEEEERKPQQNIASGSHMTPHMTTQPHHIRPSLTGARPLSTIS